MSEQTSVRQRASEVLRDVEGIMGAVDAFYCDLHQHPELSLSERRTAAKAAGWLQQSGLDVTTGVGGNGVVGMVRNGSGPTIMIRGDMDALPILEETGAPYASTVTALGPGGESLPVMHACGHDVHTSCLVAAARLLAERREAWSGTLMVVAQPAEEIFMGAGPMLRDGLYTRFAKPDAVLGQHTWPLPTRTVAHRAGTIMSAAATFEVTIHGRGGHGSQPEVTVDPVVVAASTVMRLQTVVSREVKPGEPAVLTVGKLHAGTQANIIPDRASLGVNIRSQSDATHRRIIEAIHRIIRAECQAAGCAREPGIVLTNGAPCTVNDAVLVERVRTAHAAWFGEENVVEMERLMATEDFSMYGSAGPESYGGDPVPVAYWFLGVVERTAWDAVAGDTPADKMRRLPGVHTPVYLPERPGALRAGIEAMVMGALACLAAPR